MDGSVVSSSCGTGRVYMDWNWRQPVDGGAVPCPPGSGVDFCTGFSCPCCFWSRKFTADSIPNVTVSFDIDSGVLTVNGQAFPPMKVCTEDGESFADTYVNTTDETLNVIFGMLDAASPEVADARKFFKPGAGSMSSSALSTEATWRSDGGPLMASSGRAPVYSTACGTLTTGRIAFWVTAR
jgi:hypothetical protein